MYRGFNKMVEEIKRLVEIVHVSELREKELEVKQKEALLHAMQAQINPHFLYNTLEFINSNAIVEGNDKISAMIVSLGDMFRYNVQNPNASVSLADELHHIEAYLSIQAARYPSFAYEIDVDRALAASVPAVRSMLQPIVENCFKHGYDRHGIRPGLIRIAGRTEGDGFVLEIADTGHGMSADTRERFNAVFAEGEAAEQLGTMQGQGDKPASIGLLNVHARLRMIFGRSYGLHIGSSDRQGTSIRITLPLHASGEGGIA